MRPASEVDVGALDAGFSSAKRQILLSLKRQGSVSLTDLSQELRISKMATLKHLTALEDKGLVERSFKAGGRGRPRAYFRLSARSTSLFPEAYTHMTLCAQQFIEANRDRMPDGPLRGRVEELVKIRDEGGYMAELGRAGRTSIEMMEHNCPIMAVAEVYPDACGVERELFQKLLHADVETSHRVVAGDPVCRFIIRRRDEVQA